MGNITLYLKTDRITNTRTDIVVERETGEIVRKVSAGNSMSNSWQLLSGKPRKTSAQHLFRSSLSLSLSLALALEHSTRLSFYLINAFVRLRISSPSDLCLSWNGIVDDDDDDDGDGYLLQILSRSRWNLQQLAFGSFSFKQIST